MTEGTVDTVDTKGSEGQFKRAMSSVDATAVVMGSMIGSGIFIVSAETSRHLGSAGWLLLAWIGAAILTVVAALCYSELSSMLPHAGGQYVFLREAYGKLFGFLYGWTLFMVIQTGTIAAVAVAFAKFLGVFVPAVSLKNVLIDTGWWHFNTLQLVGVVLIIFLTALNCRGIHTAKFIQTTFTATKAVALVLLIALGFLSFNKFAGLQVNFKDFFNACDLTGNPISGLSLITVFSIAMVGPLFASDAWNNITFAGEEVKDAENSLPKSLFRGTLLVTLLYLLTNVVYILLLPLHGDPHGADVLSRGIQYAAEDRVGTAAAQIIFGPIGESLMAGAIMISTFGALNGCILSGPRAYYAMAKDGLFFKKAGELHATTAVPVWGLIMQCVWACILATSGKYSDLLEYVVFAALLFYVLTVAGLFILRRKAKDLPKPFKVPFYPFLPALYIVLASVIMIGQIAASPTFSGAGLLIILSGLPAYALWSRALSRGKS